MARRYHPPPDIFGLPWWLPVGAIAALVLFPNALGQIIGRITGSAAAAAPKIVYDAATGLILGIGDAVGLPRTDVEACAAAVDAGEWLTASAYCPAGTYLQDAAGAVWDVDRQIMVGVVQHLPGVGLVSEVLRIMPAADATSTPELPGASPGTDVNISDYPAA